MFYILLSYRRVYVKIACHVRIPADDTSPSFPTVNYRTLNVTINSVAGDLPVIVAVGNNSRTVLLRNGGRFDACSGIVLDDTLLTQT